MRNLLKMFRKEEVATVVEEVQTGKYPAVVEEIHNAFNSAADRDIDIAERALRSLDFSGEDKAVRLSAMGFGNVGQVQKNRGDKKVKMLSEITIKLINHYKMKYPMFKFITEENVIRICKQYGLVCGDTNLYEGFVPEKNLQDIEKFNKWRDNIDAKDDMGYSQRRRWLTIGMQDEITKISREDYEKFVNKDTRRSSIYSYIYSKLNMSIAAPLKDMHIGDDMVVNDRMQIVKKRIEIDPIVLYPVRGEGYLIVTAWGDEASDPDVVNTVFN